MPTLAELLDPGARQRLAALAQPSAPDLVDLARQAAAESTGDGRAAWLCVAVAIAAAETPDQARAALDRALDGPLKTIAMACLGTLDDVQARTFSREHHKKAVTG